MSVAVGSFRAEKLVLSSEFTRELEGRGLALYRIEHYANGSSMLELVSIADGDTPPPSDDLTGCDCPDCQALAAIDWQRQRLISQLKTRTLQLGGHLCDDFHPWGRCTCGQQGACSWCESTCLGCGGVPHEGDCPELADVVAELPPALRELGALE